MWLNMTTLRCHTVISKLILIILKLFPATVLGSWEEWWTYDGISGPDFWGLLNPEWSLCSRGRRQSPVNVDPDFLLFDPKLGPFQVDKEKVRGFLENTGHSVVFRVNPSYTSGIVNLSGGPLSYRYQFYEVHLHYGRSDDRGSEHTIAGYAFPAEIQIYGFNNQLYESMNESLEKTQGIVGIALLLQLGEISSPQIDILTEPLDKITYKGMQANIHQISIRDLLPDTSHYITYEGSTTMPGCFETVTWIIVNKPLYITKNQLQALRKLMQGELHHPKTNLADNFRPPLALHHRPVRTNIALKQDPPCPTERTVHYKANVRRRRP